MNRAAILIGINRVNGLPTLTDAVRGSKRMHEWVLAQGFAPDHVVLITDESGPVAASDLQNAIKRLLEPMAGIEQLLIYFAGHGLNINYGEFWLLSQGLVWPTESVDVARSVVLARYCTVPHVIFISDACRTAAAGVQQQLITGSPIFPMVAGGGIEKAVDQFFACTLGNPALEIQAQDAANAGTFVALYTEALLAVLEGDEPSIIEVAGDGELPDGVIRPWPLKHVLRERVSRLLVERGLHTRAFQTPDARIASDPQLAWIARLLVPPQPGPLPRNRDALNFSVRGTRDLGRFDSNMSAPSLPLWVESMLEKLLSSRRFRAPWEKLRFPAPWANTREAYEITTQAWRQSKEFTPLGFETWSGIKLRGGKAIDAICPGTQIEWVVEGEILRAYPQSHQASDRVLLVFDNGSGMVVPLLPKFTAELSLDNGQCVGLAYEASENSKLHESDLEKRIQRRYLREFVAAAVERGVFQPDRLTLIALTARLHDASNPDPILLVYLAYALVDAGMVGHLRDLLNALRAKGVPLLFDLALLASRPGEKLDDLSVLSHGIPLLARGWAGLAAKSGALSEELSNISRMRYPNMWSQFTSEGVHIIRQQLRISEVHHHA